MKIGIHAGTSGWTDRCIEVARELGAECYLWLAFTPSGPHRPADALRYPNATHIVRVANPQPGEDPAVWMARIAPALDPWVAAGIPPGALIVQHANEPNWTGVDLGVAWGIDAWLAAAHGYRDALKARYPALPLLAPPFTCASTKALTAAYVAPYEGVAVHCYWSAGNPGWRQGEDGGAAWRVAAAFGKPVWVTEVNSNPADTAELLAWAREVDSPLVEGATLFLADGAQSWPAYDVTPEIAAAVRAGLNVAPPPPPPPPVAAGYTRDSDPRGYRPLDARWRPFVAAHNPDEADAICNAYEEGCRAIGYDANCAIAQGCVEAAIFTSPRWVNAHAAAGIGIYSDGTPDVIWGASPATPHGDARTGVLAQCELLSDYYGSGVEPWGIIAPHGFGFAAPLGKTRLSDMDGVWAADKGYSAAIVGYLTQVLGGDGPPAPPPATGITLTAIRDIAAAHIGKTITDEGVPEFGMCEQEFEEWCEEAGLPRTRYATAAADGTVRLARGEMRATMPPPPGAGLIWEPPFDPSGHICCADDYPYVITTYPGSVSRIDAAANGWYAAAGFIGWFVPDGATEGEKEATDVHTDGKFDDGRLRRLWDGSKTKAQIKSVGGLDPNRGVDDRWITELKAGRPVGYAVSKEEPMPTGGVIRYFSSGFICYYPDGSTTVN